MGGHARSRSTAAAHSSQVTSLSRCCCRACTAWAAFASLPACLYWPALRDSPPTHTPPHPTHTAGCDDGQVVVWDMETRGVARTYRPHTAPVSSLAWSRDGRLLLSGGADGVVAWWDMEANAPAHRAELGRSVAAVCIVPRQPRCCLVSFITGAPALVTVAEGTPPGACAEVVDVPTLVIGGSVFRALL